MVRGQLAVYSWSALAKSVDGGGALLWKRAPFRRCLTTQASPYSDDYQYMQRSKLPTMYFQRSLPRLPIPLVEKTGERFLAAVQPLLSPKEYEDTKQVVAEFVRDEGVELNALLKQHDSANKHTSYISEPWFDMYLRDRLPLPLNYNPLLLFKQEERPEYRSQIVRAANLVISSLRFWRSLQDEILEPEVFHLNPKKSDTDSYRRWMRVTPQLVATYVSYVFKAFPLDMSQYHCLFGTSRIPEQDKDRLTQNPNSRHILVMRRGNMYAVDVLDANGNIEPPTEILARLRTVLRLDEERGRAELPLGVLTTGERNDWARARKHLCLSKHNETLLEEQIDGALFCLCLDGAEDPIDDEEDRIPLLKHLLAGSGHNRWFDKSVSLLISADGTAAVNFEHSWGDGVAVLRYFNEIYKETSKRPFISSSDLKDSMPCNDMSAVRYLKFELDEKLRSEISQADAKNTSVMQSLQLHLLRYQQLSRVACKRDRLSPDSIMQLSFQLAYRQIYTDYVGTYESCSTAAFRHGRTETMRPCTLATKEFCETVLSPNIPFDPKKLRVLIDKCSTIHGQLIKEAAMGQGFDRHLFALKHMADVHDKPVPLLYTTEAYKRLNSNTISTSTLSSDALLAGAFGPVVRNGLGIAYSIQKDYCGAIVSSYDNGRNGKDFIGSLEQAFNTIRKVIDESK